LKAFGDNKKGQHALTLSQVADPLVLYMLFTSELTIINHDRRICHQYRFLYDTQIMAPFMLVW